VQKVDQLGAALGNFDGAYYTVSTNNKLHSATSMKNISEYQIFELTGNKKTKSGDQIEEWITPQVADLQMKMQQWHWSKPFEFEMPDKPIATQFDDVLKENGLPDKLPELVKVFLYSSSKLTDFIKGSFLQQYGLIVSANAKVVLEQFNIGKHKFYPIIVNQKSDDHDDYYFFKSLTNANQYVDVKKSSFYLQEGYFNTDTKRPVTFASYKEIETFRLNNSVNDIYIFADKICLNENFPDYDYFTINEFGIHNKFISPMLADGLKALTGFHIKKDKLYD
jgi:hypothetical protein